MEGDGEVSTVETRACERQRQAWAGVRDPAYVTCSQEQRDHGANTHRSKMGKKALLLWRKTAPRKANGCEGVAVWEIFPGKWI